jgi:hypothetical protein
MGQDKDIEKRQSPHVRQKVRPSLHHDTAQHMERQESSSCDHKTLILWVRRVTAHDKQTLPARFDDG